MRGPRRNRGCRKAGFVAPLLWTNIQHVSCFIPSAILCSLHKSVLRVWLLGIFPTCLYHYSDKLLLPTACEGGGDLDGRGKSIFHCSLFTCSQVQIHVIWLLYKDGKDVELWWSGVLPLTRLENPLIGRHICSTNNCPFISGYQTLKTHEEWNACFRSGSRKRSS